MLMPQYEIAKDFLFPFFSVVRRKKEALWRSPRFQGRLVLMSFFLGGGEGGREGRRTKSVASLHYSCMKGSCYGMARGSQPFSLLNRHPLYDPMTLQGIPRPTLRLPTTHWREEEGTVEGCVCLQGCISGTVESRYGKLGRQQQSLPVTTAVH